jgi:hypothetical protein
MGLSGAGIWVELGVAELAVVVSVEDMVMVKLKLDLPEYLDAVILP